MHWRKNRRFLAIGGLAGLALIAIIDAMDKEENANDVDRLELLLKDIRENAQWAMGECVTDEDREMVYAQVRRTLYDYQIEMQEMGEEIISNLRKQAANAPSKEEFAVALASRVQEFKAKMDIF